MWFEILLCVVGVVILIYSGDWLVRGASNIAYKMMISPLVVGLTVVAFGTSAPELFISGWAALKGQAGLAIGNVVGSNICNLSLVLGATALFYPIIIKHKSVALDWILTIGSGTLLFIFILLNGKISFIQGLLFVTILIAYTWHLIRSSIKENKAIANSEQEKSSTEDDDEIPPLNEIIMWKEIAFFLLGIGGLYIGVTLFGENILKIAMNMGMTPSVAGLTVVAFATSLPELITSVIAAVKKNTDLALGNLLGSCIFNVFSILGITSMITDIPVEDARIVAVDLPWMFALMLLIAPMIFITKKFGKVSGFILIGFYVAYTTVLILMETGTWSI